MKLTTIAIGLMAMTMSLPASTILFGGGGGDLGSSSKAFGLVTATGYTANNVLGNLYGKGVAGTHSEDGLGLVADPTGNGEIFANLATGAPAHDFIQLDITNLSGAIQVSLGSTGGGDTWAVFGSNTLGVVGGTQLASGGGPDGAEVTVTGASSWKYLDVTATTRNVLLQDLTYTGTATPEPGTFGIVGLGGVLIGLLRRKSQQS